MRKPARKSFWRFIRRAFRWTRIFCWLVVLVLVSAFIYVNQVGLPSFVKTRLQAQLRARGFDVEFERVRLRWYEGIVAERLSFARAEHGGPQFSVAEAKVGIDADALWQRHLKITSVLLRQGELTWPLTATNQTSRIVKLDQLGTELHFLPNDQWELVQFQAACLGFKLNLSGVITNATALREQRLPKPPGSSTNQGSGANLETQVLHWLAELDKIQFTAPPEVTLAVRGDARNGGGFSAELSCAANGAHTPWGDTRSLTINGRLLQMPGTNSPLHSDIVTRISRIKTEWGVASNTVVNATFTQAPQRTPTWVATWRTSLGALKTPWAEVERANLSGQSCATNQVETQFSLDASGLKTEWVKASAATVTGHVTGHWTNATRLNAEWNATLTAPSTRWGEAKLLRVNGQVSSQPSNFRKQSDTNWAYWKNLEPWKIDFDVGLESVSAPKLAVEKFTVSGEWRSPILTIQHLHTELYHGQMNGTGRLDVVTRLVEVGGGLNFDTHGIAPLLHRNDQRFLEQFAWQKPPEIIGRAGGTLAAWTNAQPSWPKDILPTVWVAAHLDCGPVEFCTVPLLSASTALNISNLVIDLPDLFVRRPEGTAELSHTAHLYGKFFHWKGRSGIDPQAIRPLLETREAREVLDMFQFSKPPEVVGEVWSQREDNHDRVGMTARVALTNFSFRGESCSNFVGAISFTNQLYHFTDLALNRGEQSLTAPEIWLDATTQTLRVTNVFSTLDLPTATRVIGPEVTAALAPYRWGKPPTARVNGSIMLGDTKHTDLHFDLSGGPFSWERFNLPYLDVHLDWVTNTLVLTNLTGDFYHGQIKGDGLFEFDKSGEADFHFTTVVSNTSLQLLVGDMANNPSNKLEGTLSGVLKITAANTADFKSWQGFGNVKLTNGLLWDFPLFGLFSPVLNAITPGLGNSRAKEATGTYLITNSVILTRDLEINSPPVRMHYDGTVGFDGSVKATMEAQLFRDLFVVGRLVSWLTTPLTKIMEYKVTGTLSDPKSEPLYIPKWLTIPLHPFRTLRGLLPGKDEPKATPEK